MITAATASFFAAGSFGLLYRVPANQLVFVGLAGAAGGVVNALLAHYVHSASAVFCGACCAALLSEIWARVRHQPVTLFLIPGIIPLVPGGQAYLTMLHFLQGSYIEGLEQLVVTLFLSGAIAGGILAVSSVFRRKGKPIVR